MALAECKQQFLKKRVVGLLGFQNAGKSTLFNLLTQRPYPWPNVGLDYHTEDVEVTQRGDLIYADFPGRGNLDRHISSFANRCAFACSAFIFLARFDDVDSETLASLQEVRIGHCYEALEVRPMTPPPPSGQRFLLHIP